MPDTHAHIDKLVFVSYSRHDAAFARRLYNRLKRAGFRLWHDRSQMVTGEKWWAQIKAAIQACETLVLCMSPHALDSPNVADEWHYARELGRQASDFPPDGRGS